MPRIQPARGAAPSAPNAAALPRPLYSIDTHGQLGAPLGQEWLLTNGLGAFASSSVVGCNTRRYHGTLCAALSPPVGRVVALSRLAETLYLGGKLDRPLELSVNQFDLNPAHFHPRGDRWLRRFELGDFARWTYEVEGATVVKELLLAWRRNVSAVRYRITPSAGASLRGARCDIAPFTGLRDFHALRHGTANFGVDARERGVRVSDGALSVSVCADAGSFVSAPDWWRNHTYRIEADRGQDFNEELFTPGRFVVEAGENDSALSVTLWASSGEVEPGDWEAELRTLAARRVNQGPKVSLFQKTQPRQAAAEAEGLAPLGADPVLPRLFRAADDFLVLRKSPDGTEGSSVMAGYPWFADWGRDTFISLPGLLLVTGRFEQALQVLGVFGRYVSEGMIPNRFDDYNNEPHYNTVDASLWYIHAAFEYLRLSKDADGFGAHMLPACRQIIEGYRKGTRFHIKMEDDGLITQGDPSTQLTWMDAKSGGHAWTPRQGKAVEINALWYHVLTLMGHVDLAAKVGESFRRVYWVGPDQGLADVVEGDRRDLSIRPNQIFAVSLPNSPLEPAQQSAVVEVVRRELLTPVGLRTLSPKDPGYKGRYAGPQPQRDATYHNGTVWPWLMGPFLSAWLRVNQSSPDSIAQAKRWLQPLLNQMQENCIGQICEICEGDAPHRPVGCPAQAWSVAETLRLAAQLEM